MTGEEFADVLARHPELRAGLPEHADEVARIASRIIFMEANPPTAPDLPDSAPAWERDYWRKRGDA